jgi:hypothetical protein
MYPDAIKPLCMVRSNGYPYQGAWLVRRVPTDWEGAQELLIVIAGVVPVQPEVGPLHEYVGDILASRLVKDGLLEGLALTTLHVYFNI